MRVNPRNYKYTYYGDLLAISYLYDTNESATKMVLDRFYQLIFDKFQGSCVNKQTQVTLFSDTLIITGQDLKQLFLTVEKVYRTLSHQGIFLRGAVVKGKLEFEPKVVVDNMTKHLPSGNVLYRAVRLEKKGKGPRFFVEEDIVKDIMPKEWLISNQYETNICIEKIKENDFRRKIVQTIEKKEVYEYLWPCLLREIDEKIDSARKDISKAFSKELSDKVGEYLNEKEEHAKALKCLLDRSKKRELSTRKYFEANGDKV